VRTGDDLDIVGADELDRLLTLGRHDDGVGDDSGGVGELVSRCGVYEVE